MPSTSRRAISEIWFPKNWVQVACALACCAWLFSPVAGVSADSAPKPEENHTHLVKIEAMKFSPDVVTVHPGDRIEFTNRDIVPHTATAVSAQGFDSGLLNNGQTWSYTPKDTGTVAYHCTYHPTMVGTIVVTPR